MQNTSDIYREEIVEEAKNPQRYGLLAEADQVAVFGNRSCGDVVKVSVKFAKNDQGEQVIDEVGWEGEGCLISRACASLVASRVVGKSRRQVAEINLEKLLEEFGLSNLSAGRRKCAEVGLRALQSLDLTNRR